MALTVTGGSSNRINHGSASMFDNLATWTWLLWIKTGTLTTFKPIFDKKTTTGYRLFSPGTGGGARLAASSDNAGGQVFYRTTTALSDNTFHCVAVTFDNAGSAGEKFNIYTGTLTAALAEASYDTTTDFTGAVSDNAAGDVLIGNNTGLADGYPAAFSYAIHWNRVLPLAELQSQQFHPRVSSGCLLFTAYGYNGTGTQPDWSGNGNAGTVTGATLSDHVPLRGLRRRRSGLYVPYAAAAAGGRTTKNTRSSPLGVDVGMGWRMSA
jgi:hypothetical protein